MKEKLLKYGIVFGKRFTSLQKKRFRDEVIKECEAMGIKHEIYSCRYGLKNTNHLIVGDVSKAKKIILAYYDTQSLTLPIFEYDPLSIKSKLKTERLILLLNTTITLLFLYLVSIIMSTVISLEQSFLKVGLLGLLLILFTIGLKSFDGFANPINYNRNSAAICLMIESINFIKNDNIALIFVDHSGSSLIGFEQIMNLNKRNKNAQYIVLDALANGKDLFVVSRSAIPSIKIPYVFIQSNKSFWFEKLGNATLITSGILKNESIKVSKTRCFNDFKIDINRLETLKDYLLESVER